MRRRLSTAVNQLQEKTEPEKSNLVAFPVPIRTKNPAAVALGKLGGSKGGKIRAARLTTEQKKAIAKKAAEVRWAKRKTE